MTQRFILDENIIILAQKGENDEGEPDLTCLSLVSQIIDICHTLVTDYGLWGKYQRQLSRLQVQDPQAAPLLSRLLNNAVSRPGKIDFRPDAEPFPEETSIPPGSQDDVPIVRLAVETRDILVTTDTPLRNELNSCGVQEVYSLQILSPAEALGRL